MSLLTLLFVFVWFSLVLLFGRSYLRLSWERYCTVLLCILVAILISGSITFRKYGAGSRRLSDPDVYFTSDKAIVVIYKDVIHSSTDKGDIDDLSSVKNVVVKVREVKFSNSYGREVWVYDGIYVGSESVGNSVYGN
jgi:hypothetical protein